MIKTLLFSTLYPSSVRPIHGIFVETRLRELLKTNLVQTKVVAPVPWFPFKSKRFGEYALFATTPEFEHRNEVDVFHPRYFLPPKVGMNIAPYTLANAALPVIKKMIADGFDFDLIDAHYYYPDGVAAGIIAGKLGKPFVVTARGTDLNLIPQHAFPRKLILETAHKASASIGVCQALMDELRDLGGDPAKLHTLRNGVDLVRFVPEPRQVARTRLGLPLNAKLLLSVGHLIERKGHFVAIEALAQLPPDVQLIIAGGGPDRALLQRLAEQLGVQSRVQFAGVVPQVDLKWWYGASDALALCSSREGWANVLLEAMACGTPVIATNIWGTPDVVSTPDAGVLMAERSGKGLADAWHLLFRNYPTREATRLHAETFSWEATTQGQIKLFKAFLASPKSSHAETAKIQTGL